MRSSDVCHAARYSHGKPIAVHQLNPLNREGLDRYFTIPDGTVMPDQQSDSTVRRHEKQVSLALRIKCADVIEECVDAELQHDECSKGGRSYSLILVKTTRPDGGIERELIDVRSPLHPRPPDP